MFSVTSWVRLAKMNFSAPASQALEEHVHNGLRQSRAKSAEFLFPLVPRSAVCALVRDARTDGQYSLQGGVYLYSDVKELSVGLAARDSALCA